jgi:hypothetical protein
METKVIKRGNGKTAGEVLAVRLGNGAVYLLGYNPTDHSKDVRPVGVWVYDSIIDGVHWEIEIPKIEDFSILKEANPVVWSQGWADVLQPVNWFNPPKNSNDVLREGRGIDSKKELNRDELIIALREAVKVICAKWGEVETPFGKAFSGNSDWWICPNGWGRPVVISREYNNAHNTVGQASLDELFEAQRRLVEITQFLASKDFTNKVNGSIKTLKAITKALS